MVVGWPATAPLAARRSSQASGVITATRAARANRLNGTHRPRSLLSGLLACGCCGGTFALRGQDRYACSNHVMNGSCPNSRTIGREALEARILDGLRERLMAPEAVAEAIRGYTEETNRLNRERRLPGEVDRRELDKVTRSLAEIVTPLKTAATAAR